MSDFQKCSICGEYGFVRSHTCDPEYVVWMAEGGDSFLDHYDNSRHVRGDSAEKAAQRFAEQDYYDRESTFEVFSISMKEADALMDTFEDDASTVEAVKAIEAEARKQAKKFTIESEVVRNFHVTEIPKAIT